MRKIYFCIYIFIFIVLTNVLFKIDPATTSLSTFLQPETITRDYKPRQPIVLVTYADGDPIFFKNQHALAASAADKGIDQILNFSRNQIDPEFYNKNKEILIQSRGSGYWLWKPYFILKVMKSLPEGAIVLYADSGVILNKSVERIVKLLDQVPLILVGQGKTVPLSNHLKQEAFKIFNIPITEKILNSQNIWAFFLALRNTSANQSLIERWLKVCESKDSLTDQPLNPSAQASHFMSHQHDQSLLSVLIALHPQDQYTVIPCNVLRNEYGIHNFHRHPERQDESPLFIAAGMPQWVSLLLWNNSLIKFIRKILY